MDEKHDYIKLSFIGFCLLVGLVACQKNEKKETKIIDDNNGQYAGKYCYGSAIENQYVLR